MHAGVGIEHANPTAGLMERLQSVSFRGGKDNVGAVTPLEDTGDEDGAGDDGPETLSLPENANENGVNNSNGGASAGNGGAGGDGAPGGLVVAGDVVSNARAVSVLNATLVRVSVR